MLSGWLIGFDLLQAGKHEALLLPAPLLGRSGFMPQCRVFWRNCSINRRSALTNTKFGPKEQNQQNHLHIRDDP